MKHFKGDASYKNLGTSSICLSADCTTGIRSPAYAEGFPPACVFRPALMPNQPPIQRVPGVLSPGVKRGGGVTLTTHSHPVPRSFHVEFVVDRATLGQGFLRVLPVSPVSIIPPWSHTYHLGLSVAAVQRHSLTAST
jgi:hypothetical protein